MKIKLTDGTRVTVSRKMTTLWGANPEISTGLLLQAYYFQPRTGRGFYEVENIWTTRDGMTTHGRQFYEDIDDAVYEKYSWNAETVV